MNDVAPINKSSPILRTGCSRVVKKGAGRDRQQMVRLLRPSFALSFLPASRSRSGFLFLRVPFPSRRQNHKIGLFMLPRHTLLRKSSYGEGERIFKKHGSHARAPRPTQSALRLRTPHSETDWVGVSEDDKTSLAVAAESSTK